jgi:type I restriction enzyme S subunit
MTVPKLRFPEFRDAGEWEIKSLGEVYLFKVTNSFSRDKLNYKNGLVKNIHYGDIHTKFSTLFNIENEIVPFINPSESLEKIKLENYCVEGDIIFADASEDLDDVGKSIEIVNLNNEKLLSGLHTLLARQIEPKLVIGFGGYLFKSNGIRTGIKKVSHGTKILSISAGRLAGVDIYFPTDKKEQQKIADCLSFLDDRITAETQKLDTLKAHKKGLMQQLFPAEGETFPKLRFPEFRDAGEWEKKELKDACQMQAGKFIHATEIQELENKGLYPCYGGNGLRGYTKSFTHDGKYPLIGRQGALCGNITLAEGKFHATEHAVVSTPRKGVVTGWLFYKLVFLNLNRYATGQAQPGLSVENLGKVSIQIPTSKEQQKIADCLSSLDELITAQTQKIDTLKSHKKGLMQQLFPSAGEVTI